MGSSWKCKFAVVDCVKGISLCISMSLLMITSVTSEAEIVWSGNYEAGNFRQWHRHDDPNSVAFFAVPEYGRPIQYQGQNSAHVGSGELLSLVAATDRTVNGVFYPKGPTRGESQYAAKFTVKNSRSGSEPADCDGDVCTRRRSELTVQATLPQFYNALTYQSDHWVSISHFIPSDWDNSGSGWGPLVFQIKPRMDGGGVGPCISIHIANGKWLFNHRWTDVRDLRAPIPGPQNIKYSSSYPNSAGTDDGADLRADFPNQSASQAALADLNKGGWTDWVMHMVLDARGTNNGGEGILEVWKRAGTREWIKVLNIEPRQVKVGSTSYNRGICYNSPDGFGIKAGMYMDKSQVWGLESNRVLYNANIKVGNANANFEDMAPDGSAPWSRVPEGELPPPRPPTLLN